MGPPYRYCRPSGVVGTSEADMMTLAQGLAALERLHEAFGFRYEEFCRLVATDERLAVLASSSA